MFYIVLSKILFDPHKIVFIILKFNITVIRLFYILYVIEVSFVSFKDCNMRYIISPHTYL